MKKIFVAVVACAALATSACGTATPATIAVEPSVESYGLCLPATTYPCVVTDGGAYLVVVAPDGSGYPMPACAAEDGAAPCVWDSATRGDGKAGPNVKRFVIIRD